jgi:hypothetical protein
VDAVGTARLDVRLELERLERLADQVRDLDREREAVVLVGRIEVEEHEVRPVGLVDPRVPRVHVDAVHLHHPEQRVGGVDEREVDHARAALARERLEPARRDPRRDALRRLLLKEAPAGQPLAPALHRERTVAQVGHEHGRDGGVVVE